MLSGLPKSLVGQEGVTLVRPEVLCSGVTGLGDAALPGSAALPVTAALC